MRAASGKQSKASMHASYTLSEYFILPESRKESDPRLNNRLSARRDFVSISVMAFTTTVTSVSGVAFGYPYAGAFLRDGDENTEIDTSNPPLSENTETERRKNKGDAGES